MKIQNKRVTRTDPQNESRIRRTKRQITNPEQKQEHDIKTTPDQNEQTTNNEED